MKQIPVRLPDDLGAELEATAKADEQSMNAVVVEAVREHLDRRRQDPEFRERVKAIIERERAVLDRLADPAADDYIADAAGNKQRITQPDSATAEQLNADAEARRIADGHEPGDDS